MQNSPKVSKEVSPKIVKSPNCWDFYSIHFWMTTISAVTAASSRFPAKCWLRWVTDGEDGSRNNTLCPSELLIYIYTRIQQYYIYIYTYNNIIYIYIHIQQYYIYIHRYIHIIQQYIIYIALTVSWIWLWCIMKYIGGYHQQSMRISISGPWVKSSQAGRGSESSQGAFRSGVPGVVEGNWRSQWKAMVGTKCTKYKVLVTRTGVMTIFR